MEESAISALVDSVSERVGDWKLAAGQTVSDITDRATEAVSSAGRAVDETFDRAKYRARAATQNARYHVRRVTDEKPLQVIAAVAATAFIAGVLVRVWRSNRHA